MISVICKFAGLSLVFALVALQVEGQFHFRPAFRMKNPELVRYLNHFAGLESLKGASWGMVIRDAEKGEILVQRSGEENFIPASNMKVLTSMNAFHHLGKDFRFRTVLYSDGEIADGVLKGNLFVEGSGDPTPATDGRDRLNAGFFRQVTAMLREKGIREITGNIFERNNSHPYAGIRKDWSWSDVGNYYGAGIYPLNINENQFHTYVEAVRQGSSAQLKKVDSLSGRMQIDEIKLETTAPGSPDLANFFWIPGTRKIRMEGSIPQEAGWQKVKGALQDPPALFLEVLENEIQKAGILIKKEVAGKKKPEFLGEALSPSLTTIAAEVNLNSNNLYTESLAYSLCTKDDRCLENGWTHLERFVRLTNFPAGYYLADGSGLSPSNRISPAGISNALVWALKQNWADSFLKSLPVAGESGTMKNFCKGVKGRIRAKSGTLTRTLCYSGYAETKKGRVAFSLMVNNYHGPFKAMKEAVGELLESFVAIR